MPTPWARSSVTLDECRPARVDVLFSKKTTKMALPSFCLLFDGP
ncbi:hypothetical protein PC128_g16296 [Phytophthora cactorum]|nr:hypothetical protein PC128_g16296 [Phytophthora cactorum]